MLESGAHLVIQTLNDARYLSELDQGLRHTLGPHAMDCIEFSVTELLPVGRAAAAPFDLAHPLRQLRDLPPCSLLHSPTVRYDGVISPCCNEEVITGHGPSSLRRTARTSNEAIAAIQLFQSDPALEALSWTKGIQELSDETGNPEFRDTCSAC